MHDIERDTGGETGPQAMQWQGKQLVLVHFAAIEPLGITGGFLLERELGKNSNPGRQHMLYKRAGSISKNVTIPPSSIGLSTLLGFSGSYDYLTHKKWQV
jgi:hypothetical protein